MTECKKLDSPWDCCSDVKDEMNLNNENIYTYLLETYLKMNAFQEPKLEVKIIDEVLNNKSNVNRYEEVVECLNKKRPIQYYAGYTYVCDKKLVINEDVLIPGPEMDILIKLGNKYIKSGAKVMDMCTGSGVVSVILASENKDVNFYACDISEKALNVAEKNKNLYALKNVEFLQGDMFNVFDKEDESSFDVIISNPPYFKTSIIKDLPIQLKDNAPTIAIDGGESGLNFYEVIISNAPKYLKNNGYVIFENDPEQSEKIADLFVKFGFDVIDVVKDHEGDNRFIIGKLKNK